ncbi:MAG TPA: sigma-54 dependent transcriptional regulator [Dissulfurispiraceae bacterium]|nr:sigma-54 dependent transcriptional regulator [Dissulfurispiraceae bacterium]
MNRKNLRILIVDDDKSFLLLMSRILEDAGYTIKGAGSPEEALKIIDVFAPNLIISDLKMPKMDGIHFMKEVKKHLDVDFIMITAFATVDSAVAAMKMGAEDYITKPLKDPDQLRLTVSKVFDRRHLIVENALLKQAVLDDVPPMDVLFAGMKDVLEEIRNVAPTDATVILYGETGTGKTLVAKILHMMSGRKGMFVDVNCAAIPENLLESELFGYERGAFTGALAMKKGKFEIAGGGSILLDEVSEMSPALQAKLLKVLHQKTFERLGSIESLKSNARVIAATNRDLRHMVNDGKFREDLYYRLNVFPVSLPPLRERRQQIEMIARYLVDVISGRLGKKPKTLPDAALTEMIGYNWPGNIRELENIIERAVIVSKGSELRITGLCSTEVQVRLQVASGDLKTVEKEAIINALSKTGGNRTRAAETLGISLRSLQYKIKEYGVR